MTELATRTLLEAFRPDAISADTLAVNEKLIDTLAHLPEMKDLAATREAFAAGRAGLPASPKSPHARTIEIAGPGGPIGLRILAPDVIRGVFLHIHGGGWMIGTNDMWDDQLVRLGREAGLACVSVEYRLAPEHVFPAAVDDCVAAALWLIEHAEAEFGTSALAIGGESAGAHLTAATLLRLRELGKANAFRAANLMFGCYDLSLTPSIRRAAGTPFVDRASVDRFATTFLGGMDARDPAVSPLYADLSNLPPALFSVGSSDPLVDDSLFMHMRWQAAGNESELAVYPGGVHGFNSLGGELADAANHHVGLFLRSKLDGTK
jgi:acetyl esterase/lipase